ncbi:MAG TPA: ABC transporter ATP-binding protein [Syntrophorhabdaceae bacterium]|jgi:branched-chain amino acid transport system ATP-binding protein|nr:ABC transporter ATP-binding protein [Syntrophorhabdaceae bacterium]MDI9560215.1 ABC transporter ATP-binding protein [Pseudomonadota bacterium]OQC47809.1 MAG: High-affinity branched-chain amino acid transport ATP-binding protein LivF [Deltaproteobacteria bacterium ADurb.Bin026]MBP8699570.1 ABC transporter ATP-binding protein [Syntrophorhabdaceae bacterium]MBV6504941.1 High-affinity branched-chain amino acid transport ATP-binding protein LivF [Syntrophorhabdaceae bacterium]
MLDVKGVDTYYGLSHILFDVSLTVSKGEIVGLLGRNGAGKSTTMRSIMGLTPPKKGRITYKGEDITGQKPFRLFRKGIGYVPDDRRVFADLSVDDNLEIVFRSGKKWSKERVYDLFPALYEINSRRAGNLSGGEQQMLTIARALMGEPELLLLDEPTEGLAPLIVRDLEDQILKLKDIGISILLSEQNVRSALRMISRAYVIDNGRIRFEGTVAELEANEEVKKKYLMV